MKTIIFFSWQHLWSMNNKAGAPSYHHTINYYIDSPEWDVYLFTVDRTNEELSIYEDGKVFVYSDSSLVEKLSKINKVNHISLPIKHKNYTNWAVKKASELIERLDNNEIVVYGYEVWGCEAARILSKKYNVPLVTRFQGTILSYERDTLINRLIHYPHYEALSTAADLIIMTDDGTMGEKTLRRLGNNSNVMFLRNGLDLYESYADILENTNIRSLKKELGISDDLHVILMASRLTSWKRVERGIYALKELLKNRTDVELLIAGDGDSREYLENLVSELDISEYVSFLGSVEQSKLYNYMLCSDLFMSLYDLGNLGNPTFEAMLMKKAIIALNGGDTSTVLKKNNNAVLLEYDEVDKIPKEINHILNDKEFKEKLESNAFSFAQNNFYSWKTRLQMEENAVNKVFKY